MPYVVVVAAVVTVTAAVNFFVVLLNRSEVNDAVKVCVLTKPIINDTISYNKLMIYDLKKPIGSGAFGDVFKACHKDWGCLLAYKKLDVRYVDDK